MIAKLINLLEEINKKIELICILLMVSLLSLLFYSVITRYVFNRPFAWSYELSVVLFVWLVFLGSSVVMWRLEHLRLFWIRNILSNKAKNILDIVSLIGIILMSIVAIKEGYALFASSMYRTFRTIPISIGWLYAAVPVSFLFILLDSIVILFNKISIEKGQKL